MATCSGTLNNLYKDTDPPFATPHDILRAYTPKGMDGAIDFVVRWLQQPCPCIGPWSHPTDTSWQELVKHYARHPRRATLEDVWCDSVRSLASWRSNWLPLMRAADFWDIPCLYWHMVYICHERADVLARMAVL